MRKAIFVRVGRMRFYNGPVPGDERPVDGGQHNESQIGGEVYNFRTSNKRLYGYFQPSMAGLTLNLTRIDPGTTDRSRVNNVLVIMVARRVKGGQVIVGWYDHAEVYRSLVPQSPGKPKGYGHFCSALYKDCVLLPDHRRTFEVPRAGGMGRANVCYVRDKRGELKDESWMTEAIGFIEQYDGANILFEPEADAEEESAELAEKALARSKGQGFARNSRERKALEDRAMQAAARYFRKEGYVIEDVSTTRSYDLLCRKKGVELHVEVKGKTTDGSAVVLTRNEVSHAAATDAVHGFALFVLHTIRLENGKASGGKAKVLDPWQIDETRLRAISYTYQLS